MAFTSRNFLQSSAKKTFLRACATGINYRTIDVFGTDASLEVVFHNQNVLASLKAIYKQNKNKTKQILIALLVCCLLGFLRSLDVCVSLRDCITKLRLVRPTMTCDSKKEHRTHSDSELQYEAQN